MKALKTLLLLIIVSTLVMPNGAQAQTFGVRSYNLKINGSSSLHDWESSVEKLDAKGSFVITNNALTDIRDVVVKIPVTAIKSTKGKMMDNKTYEAFRHEKYPEIVFTLTAKTIHAARQTMTATGNLAMAGVTKSIDLELKYKLLPGGDLQVSGSKKLVMTQFKMDPPTAMMGTIKVGDEVTVTFDLVLSPGGMVKARN